MRVLSYFFDTTATHRDAGRPVARGAKAQRVHSIATLVAVFFAMLTFVLVMTLRERVTWMVGLWTIAPPVYFFFEYLIMLRRAPNEPDEELKARREDAKVFYDLARNVWAAFTLILIFLVKKAW